MRKPKREKVYFCFGEQPDLINKIWSEITSYQNQKWKVPDNKKPLEAIIGKDETDKLYAIKDSIKQNIKLRNILYKPLRDQSPDIRLKAIKWIVFNWGRIPKGAKDYPIWVEELQSYQPNAVNNFILQHKNKRVSSWSKVLAFADSKKYAIFDSRVAISLNTILDDAGYGQRFFMPIPRSDELKVLFENVRDYVKQKYSGKRKNYMGYFDYMNLLRAMVEHKPDSNILEVEMRLFANSRRLATQYAQKYGIPYSA